MNILVTTRYLAEYAVLRLVIGTVRLLPLDTAVRLSASAWQKLAPRGRRHQRALDNLKKAYPEKSDDEREEIALAMWGNLGRVMAETMVLDRILDDPERIEILNEGMLQRYYGKMGSAVCTSLHTGNWELAMWPLSAAGMKPAAVYRLVKNPFVDLYLRNQRKTLYPSGLFARGGQGRSGEQDIGRMIGSYIRKGGRVGFLTDLHDRKGKPIPFFGHDAPTNVFPALLARRLGTRMWVGRCIRINNESRFQVEVKELKVPRTQDMKQDIDNILVAMNKQFEEWIREYPDQWMWSNRRWS